VYRTGGTAVAVTDDDLLAAQVELAGTEGAFICPEGAACFAAARQLRADGWLNGTEEVVVLNTGTGIKYPETVAVDVPVLAVDGRIPAL
ncbi:MAG TPA: pyridoxal-phosphate dependent enzyme, partial [Pseudonocardiaceae bacterium]